MGGSFITFTLVLLVYTGGEGAGEICNLPTGMKIAPIAQLVSALDLVTSSVQVEGSILTAGKRLSLKNLNVIIRAIN